MTGKSITPMAIRMKPLPSRHRIAHLRSLIGLQPRDSDRREQLVELLLEETSVGPAE
jgi:GcrA cell cycle regulator